MHGGWRRARAGVHGRGPGLRERASERARGLLPVAPMALTRLLAAAVFAGLVSGAEVAEGGDRVWHSLAAPAGLERATALALDVGAGRLAAGGERGAASGPLPGPLERVLSRGAVRELHFARSVLWAATDAGLWRIEGGSARPEVLAPGELSRSVRDLASAGNRLVAATDAGVFLSESPGEWRRLSGLPGGSALRVELEPDGVVWAVFEGDLWRRAPDGAARRVRAPGAATGEEGVLDLFRDERGALWVLRSRSLSVRDPSGGWRSAAPTLPPGSGVHRLLVADGGVWIASDAGLLRAPGLRGPWQRAASPVGHRPVSAVAGNGQTLLVATGTGLFRSGREAERVSSGGAAASGDPPVGAVHRAALRHLALEPSRMRELAEAAGRSAWLPELSVGVDYEEGRGRRRDFDEAFVSGQTRFLLDRDESRFRDTGVFLELEWDLGRVIFHPDRLDVSRESRLVAQLRDDVLDELTQLYFERQRVLAELAAGPADAPPTELQLRAAELAAGIDAWTGGWFSAQSSASSLFSARSGAGESRAR